MTRRIVRGPAAQVAWFSAALLCIATPARADRGAIRTQLIKIEEPAQRAIIAHNGVREWLILQTDVRAARETKIVEFMPLPAKPEVSLAPEGCFAALGELVEKHGLRYFDPSRAATRAKGQADPGEAVQVVVSAQLGPHAITVVEARDAKAFVVWVREFFRQNNLGNPELTTELRNVVADYIARDLRFFAFDVVTLSAQKQTVQPLTYVFRSDSLYYPLVVTNLYGGGEGTIELFTIVPNHLVGHSPAHELFHPHPTIDARRCRILHSNATADLTTVELDALHPGLAKGLHSDKATLRAYKYVGPLRFERDVREPLGYANYHLAATAFISALAAEDREALDSLSATPFMLSGESAITDRDELVEKLLATKPRRAAADVAERWAERHVPFNEIRDQRAREFLRENLHEGVDQIIGVVSRQGRVEFYVFLQRSECGFYRVAGFLPQ